jgi:hypothetical protein
VRACLGPEVPLAAARVCTHSLVVSSKRDWSEPPALAGGSTPCEYSEYPILRVRDWSEPPALAGGAGGVERAQAYVGAAVGLNVPPPSAAASTPVRSCVRL